MLRACVGKEFSFVDSREPSGGYRVSNPKIVVLDGETAILEATLDGPKEAEVYGRVWISDENGAFVEGSTDCMRAGESFSIELKVRQDRQQNGPLLANIRIESSPLNTRHVVHTVLGLA